MFRNFIAVLFGLLVGATIIVLIINIDSRWIEYNGDIPFLKWQTILKNTNTKDEFYIALLIAGGFGSTIGGIVAAMIVRRAKQAYAMFIGMIFFFIAMGDILINAHHPTFYEVGLFFVFFPFAWLGGKLVDFIYRKFFGRTISKIG